MQDLQRPCQPLRLQHSPLNAAAAPATPACTAMLPIFPSPQVSGSFFAISFRTSPAICIQADPALAECQLLPHLVLVEDFPDAAIRSRRIAAQTRRAVMSSFLIGTNIDRSLRNGGARSTRCLTAGRTESESSGLSSQRIALIGLSKAPDMPRLIPVVEDEYSALFRISLNPSVSVESRFWTHLRRSRSLLRPAACACRHRYQIHPCLRIALSAQ